MPKKTNDFQALVYFLKRELADGARVTESAMVRDADGKDREVDVLIEGELAGHPIAIAIECRDQARKQPVGWVEEMWGKHQGMPTDRLVLISRSGFTGPAKIKAERLGIEALSFEEASAEEAARRVLFGREVSLVQRRLKIEAVDLRVEMPDSHVVEVEGNTEMVVLLEDGTQIGVLADTVLNLLNEPRFVELLESHRDLRDPDDGFEAVWRNPKFSPDERPSSAICMREEPSGALRRIAEIRALLGFDSVRSDIAMQFSRIGDSGVAWGSAKLGSADALLVVPDSDDPLNRGAWLRTEGGDVRLTPISREGGYSAWQKEEPPKP